MYREEEGMTDKQYDGMLKDAICSLDRIASVTKDIDTLRAIYKERQMCVLKLGYDVEEGNLYTAIK